MNGRAGDWATERGSGYVGPDRIRRMILCLSRPCCECEKGVRPPCQSQPMGLGRSWDPGIAPMTHGVPKATWPQGHFAEPRSTAPPAAQPGLVAAPRRAGACWARSRTHWASAATTSGTDACACARHCRGATSPSGPILLLRVHATYKVSDVHEINAELNAPRQTA